MTDGKFVSVMTNTFASEITYKEWKKKIEEFFFADERVIILLKQNGMTKYTVYKTDDVEPVKSITIFGSFKFFGIFVIDPNPPILLNFFLPLFFDVIFEMNFTNLSAALISTPLFLYVKEFLFIIIK